MAGARLMIATLVGCASLSGLMAQSCAAAEDRAERAELAYLPQSIMPPAPMLPVTPAPTSTPDRVPSNDEMRLEVPRQEAPQTEFALGPGDQLKVTVWGYPELSEEVAILPDGTISYPLIGTLQASGLTASDLASTISTTLEPHIEAPHVSLVISQMRSRRFSVAGEVGKPGTFPLWDNNVTVLEAVAQAGGLGHLALPAETKIFRQREHGGGNAIRVDLTAIFEGAIGHADFTLKPGDVVYIPSQMTRRKVSVLGEVRIPGLYSLSPNMTVVEALTAAGWVTPAAVLKSVMVARRGREAGGRGERHELFRVDTHGLIEQQDWSQDLVLQPGDIVYVPKTFLSKVGSIVSMLTSKVEPAASTYLRLYDASDPSTYVIDR